jgi:vacuolar-type H+-ATPase subunit H
MLQRDQIIVREEHAKREVARLQARLQQIADEMRKESTESIAQVYARGKEREQKLLQEVRILECG